MQQTWLQIIRRWDRVSQLPWSETEGYLVTAVKNTAVDMLRRERREEALPEDWDPPAPETGEGAYRYLVSLIRALPEAYRRVLELKCVEEESNREIARRLGISEMNSRTRLFRAKNHCKKLLEKNFQMCHKSSG